MIYKGHINRPTGIFNDTVRRRHHYSFDGTQNYITSSLNNLEVIGTLSGLKMNTDKTKLNWMGWRQFSKDKPNSK